MRAVEFKSQLENNSIPVPKNIQKELVELNHKNLHVILMFDEAEKQENNDFKILRSCLKMDK